MKKITKRRRTLLAGLAAMLFAAIATPLFVFADWTTGLALADRTLLPSTNFLVVLISVTLWLFMALTIVSVTAFVAAGIMLILSGGNTEIATRARRWITYSIFGLAVALGSISIILTIVYIVGVPFVSTILSLLGIAMPGTVDEIFLRLVQWLLLVLTFLSVISFVASGIMLILSGGDPNVAGRARKWIIYSIVGLTVALASYSIIGWVDSMV